MHRHEAAFLEGALHVGDPILERRLLIGYGLITAIEAMASGDPPVVARLREMLAAEKADVFAGAPSHLASLRRLARSLESPSSSRRAVHSALVDYAVLIALEDHTDCALAALSLSERIWDESCNEEDALKAFYRYSLIMVRGKRPIEECDSLYLTLALRARSSGSALYRGLARVLHVDVQMYRGLLPKARASARRALAYGTRAGFPEIVLNAQLRLAAIEGRAGAYDRVLAHAAAAYVTGRNDPLLRQNALNLMARALIDLGRLDDARRALELASVSERSAVQTLVMIGLMDLAVLTDDVPRFTKLRDRLERTPMAPAHRIYYLKLAALGTAATGDLVRARAMLEDGRQLARAVGFNFEYLDLDTELSKLGEREAAARHPGAPTRGTPTAVDAVLLEIERDHHASLATVEAALA